MGRPKKVIPKTFRCLKCGKETTSDREFYKNRSSRLYLANDNCVCICRECVDGLFDTYTKKYNSLKKACMIMCAMLDYPFLADVFTSVKQSSPVFSFGIYVRQMNVRQNSGKTTEYSIMNGEFGKTDEMVQEAKEQKWSKDEIRIRNEVIGIVGYDPFNSYPDGDRKILFAELSKFLGDDDDAWKISQLIEAVVTNFQIARYDRTLARLDIIQNADDFDRVSSLKKDAVMSLDKIAKENEISIKNRSNKAKGSGTLTYLMRDLRSKDIKRIEEDFYEQLKSPGTMWAAEMSAKSLMNNAGFDENDAAEIRAKRSDLIAKLYTETDDLKEKNRRLMVKIQELGGDLNEFSESASEEQADNGSTEAAV